MSYFQYAIFSILLFTANLIIAQEDTLVSQNFEYDKTQNLTPVSFDEVQLEDYKNDSDLIIPKLVQKNLGGTNLKDG